MKTKLSSLILFTVIATLFMLADSCKDQYNKTVVLQAKIKVENNFTESSFKTKETQQSDRNNKNYFGGMNFYLTSSFLQGAHRQGCAAIRSTFRAEVGAIN